MTKSATHNHATPPGTVETANLADLTLDPANARKHDRRNLDAIKASLHAFGVQGVLAVVDADGIVRAGNGRVAAARKMGWTDAPVFRSPLRGAEAVAYAIADNRTSELATWDDDTLAQTLAGLQSDDIDHLAAGFTDAEIDGLISDMAGGEVVEDDVPEPPDDPITQPGDVWALGKHRLLCGDSTKADDVSRLMGGEEINVAFTSPPYADRRKYDENSGFKPIPPAEYVEWFRPIAENVKANLAEDGSWFVNIKPSATDLDNELYVFDLVIAHSREWGWHFATEFCWERSGIPKGVTRRFKNQFEPIYQFATGEWKMRPNAVRHESSSVPKARGKGAGSTSWAEHQGQINMTDHQGEVGFKWFGDNIERGLAYPGNRLPTFAGTHEALGHAAAFPVGLPSFFLKAYSDKGDTIYDPFLGSGSTLIAAEQLGRKCHGIEISPQYCDIVIQRWEKLTGKKAELLENAPHA